MPDLNTCLSEHIPGCASLIPKSSNSPCYCNDTNEYNWNTLSTLSLNNVMKCNPLPNLNPCRECPVPGHVHLKKNLTMINLVPSYHNCRKYNHENADNSVCLTKSRPQPSAQNLCLCSVAKPKDKISEDSLVSVSGCEGCAIFDDSNCCQTHNVNVIGSRCTLSSPGPHYYGYDSEYSGAETEIHCSDPSFENQSFEVADQIPIYVDVQMKAMAGAESLESDFRTTNSEEFCGSTINTLKQVPMKYFYPETEHRRLKFLKTEDDSIAAVIKESHSVEVLGSYSMKQCNNVRNDTVFLTCSVPSGLTSTEDDLGVDLGAEDGGYLSSVSDKINAGGVSDEIVNNNLTPESKSRRSSVVKEEEPHDLNKTIRTETCLTGNSHAVENADEISERSASKCIAFKDDDVLGSIRNISQFNSRKEQSELNLSIGKNDSTNFSCDASENDRGSAIAIQRNSTMIMHNSPVCATSPKNSIVHSQSQSEFIRYASSVTDNVNNKNGYEIEGENHIPTSLDDACTIHQTNPISSVMPETYCSLISNANRKGKSCNSSLVGENTCKDALSPEGKVGCRDPDEDNNRCSTDSKCPVVGHVDNLKYFDYCKIRKKSTNAGHERVSISNGNAVGSDVDSVVHKNSSLPKQHSYSEFAYCKGTIIHKQPVVDSHADNDDANCYSLLMSHGVTPSQLTVTTNSESEQHTCSALMTNEKWNVLLPDNGYSDYGSSSGGGGGQRMAIHHSGAQGANSSSGSKRNAFTRSLSNADVPPDEKAGKHENELVRHERLIYMKVNVCVIYLVVSN
jgi:hypothetical protein